MAAGQNDGHSTDWNHHNRSSYRKIFQRSKKKKKSQQPLICPCGEVIHVAEMKVDSMEAVGNFKKFAGVFEGQFVSSLR